jgi:ABC-type multidrug transport system fused ATPase/permease subunit
MVHKKWLWLIWFMAVVNGGLEFASTFFLKNLTDTALAQQNDQFRRLVLLALLMMVIDMAMKYFNGIISSRYQSTTLRDIRNRIAAHIQRLPIAYTETLHSGDLVSRLNNDLDKIAELTQRIHEPVQQTVVFILGFTYLYYLSWKLLLATCILIPVSAFLHDKVVRPMQAHSRREMEHLAQASAVTQDAIGGIFIIKAFNLQKVLTQKFKRIAEAVRLEGLAIDRRAGVEFAVFLMLRYTPQLVAPLYGGYLAFIGEISVGALLASVYLIWMVFIPVETALRWIRQWREITPALERMFEILDHPIEAASSRTAPPITDAPALSFHSVKFRYKAEDDVLADFSMTVAKGRIVALVGPSGCGKSTVLKLLCGFYRPQEGEVKIFGRDIFQSGLRDARQKVSLVSQDTYLFPTTIAENIAYGRLGAGKADIIAAAKKANAHAFILQQPDGYETYVGERGVRLSGGERQRIALARAILKDAPILLLDEPTSALDAQSEAIVQETLDRFMLGRTVVVVAHRLATIKSVDEIVVLEGGKLRERGTHRDLMAGNTLYKRLYLKQTAMEAQHD